MKSRCKLVIPGTFIMCGEGMNYCSDECRNMSFEKKEGTAMNVGDIITDCKEHVSMVTEWLILNENPYYAPLKKMEISYPALIIGKYLVHDDEVFWRVLDADGVVGYVTSKFTYRVNG